MENFTTDAEQQQKDGVYRLQKGTVSDISEGS